MASMTVAERSAERIAGLPEGSGTLAMLAALVRNPIESIPEEAYRQQCTALRLFGRDLVYVAHPDTVRHVLTDSETFGQNDIMRRALSPLLGDGVLTSDGPAWLHQRRAATPAFRNDAVLQCLPLMVAAGENACRRMLDSRRGPVDVTAEMMRTTLDIILGALLPTSNAIDPIDFGAALSNYLAQSAWHMAFSLLRAPHWTPYPGRRNGRRAARTLRTMVQGAVDRGALDQADGLLGLLGASVDPETQRPFTRTELLDNLLTFIAAGHETTAVTLAWTFYCLTQHPAVEAELLQEIRAVTPPGGVTAASLPLLTTTRRVIQEAMRLYPAAPMLVRTTRRPTTLAGVALGAGASVYLPIYALHRHQSSWSDPERFDPDRFLPEQSRARHRFAYLPFGAGPRVCMGAVFAMTEAVVLLATILPRIRLDLAPGSRPRALARVTLRPAQKMVMLPVERSSA